MAWFKVFRSKSMSITMDMKPLEKYTKVLLAEQSVHKKKLLKDWETIYKEFMTARFKSRGNGTWPPLRPRTRKRTKRRNNRQVLIDSHTLMNVWTPGSKNPGYQVKETKKGVTLGYGGGARHPIATRLSIEKLAEIHTKGLGRVPKRKIMEEPNQRAKQRMANRLKRHAIDCKKAAGLSS